MTAVDPAGEPSELTDAAAEAARAAHIQAAARAQAVGAARARQTAQARDVSPWAEVEREGAYAGLVTRTIAYCVDLGVLNVVALAVGAAVALALSLFNQLPDDFSTLVDALLAVVYVLWAIGYFVTFWATSGQTPGARLMRIRVIDAAGAARVRPTRAVIRFAGLVLATLPLFAGFLMMLWERRRRCLQDCLARTVVVHAPARARIVRQRVPRDRP
jgi:uncharacterized RDD family membrane protein YckC